MNIADNHNFAEELVNSSLGMNVLFLDLNLDHDLNLAFLEFFTFKLDGDQD